MENQGRACTFRTVAEKSKQKMTENLPSFAELHALVFDADRIPYALMAIILSLIVGMVTGPRSGNANPMIWIWVDSLFGWLGERLDKKQRSKADLSFRGFMIMAVAIVLFAGLGEICTYLSARYAFYGLTQTVLLTLGLSVGSVYFVLLRLYFALSQKKEMVKGAFYGVARTSRINLNSTDDYGITRVGMTMAARTFDKALVAPVFWYLVGGFTAMFVYSCIAGLAWRFGKDGFSRGLGDVPLALEKLLGVVPAILSTALISLASIFTPTANIVKSISAWWGKGAPYAQGWLPLSAMAWTLGVTLGGPAKDIGGSAIKSDWVGPKGATAKITPGHLRRALYILVMAQLLFISALLGAYLWSSYLLA